MRRTAWQAARVVNARLRNVGRAVLNRLDRPVVVLGYHRVATRPADRLSLAVSPGHFREHLRYLRERFELVRFEEDWSSARRPAVAVTFDDGYLDNLTEALPILEEVGVPATFFVSSAPLEGGAEFWWDQLERLALEGTGHAGRFVLQDPGHGGEWPTGTATERETMARELNRRCMRVDDARRAGWLRQLRAWSPAGASPAAGDRPMTATELRRLAASPLVTVGAHTMTHSSLAALPEADQAREIAGSRRRLEALLGRPVEVFSYPFGTRSDYNAATIRLCREAGFRKAATAIGGHRYRWTDPFQIPRHFVQDFDLDSFVVKVKSFWI